MSATPADCPWIPRGRPVARHTVRLICLPYAGGGAVAVFRTWKNQLAPIAEPFPVELPSRAARLREAPLAFLGHSLGALLAFEVVLQRLLPVLRAAFEMLETYEYSAEELAELVRRTLEGDTAAPRAN